MLVERNKICISERARGRERASSLEVAGRGNGGQCDNPYEVSVDKEPVICELVIVFFLSLPLPLPSLPLLSHFLSLSFSLLRSSLSVPVTHPPYLSHNPPVDRKPLVKFADGTHLRTLLTRKSRRESGRSRINFARR